MKVLTAIIKLIRFTYYGPGAIKTHACYDIPLYKRYTCIFY